MSKEITTWFAIAAFAGLAIAVSGPSTAVAQPPRRGPGGPDGPGRGGPPNVAEMFSRMDRNNDGKLTKDEVPGPVWDRLSNADANDDGGVTKEEATKAMSERRPNADRPSADRPASGRPDGPPNDRPRDEPSRSQGPRPPMEQKRGEARGQRDAAPERGRPAPPRSPNQPEREPNAGRGNAHRGPTPFEPDAFFDRLDKNNDGSLSRNEFKAVAEFHRGQHAARGPQGFRGPGGPPIAHRGPDMRGGGPPWARHDGGSSFGPHRLHGGPPWARPGYGPHFNRNFAGPPWARSAHRDHRSHHGAVHQGARHRDSKSRDTRSRDREQTHSRRPHDRDHSDANSPRSDAGVATDESQSAAPGDDSITSAKSTKAAKAATLPL